MIINWIRKTSEKKNSDSQQVRLISHESETHFGIQCENCENLTRQLIKVKNQLIQYEYMHAEIRNMLSKINGKIINYKEKIDEYNDEFKSYIIPDILIEDYVWNLYLKIFFEKYQSMMLKIFKKNYIYFLFKRK